MFINFGIINPLNPAEQLTLDTYAEVEPIIKLYIHKAYKLDEYGFSDKASVVWEYGNKIFYLIQYLTIVKDSIDKDYQSCNLKSYQYYKDKYELDCIREKFSCLTIPFDVDPLYEIFGLGTTFGYDGIGYMAIVEDENEVCNNNLVFQVNKNRI